MAEHSTIEWTDATWNPITGCTMVSAGCTNCYAMGLAATRLRNHPSRAGLTRETGGRAVWTGEVRLNEQWLDQPLRWMRPRKIFVCAHGDLFHEAVPDEWIDRVFGVMGECPQHTFQVLTKRPDRMARYLRYRKANLALQPPIGNGLLGFHPFSRNFSPPGWVWLGTSVEDQDTADARIPHLLDTPAAVRFISAEPLLGPVDLQSVSTPYGGLYALTGVRSDGCGPSGFSAGPRLDWVIVGGESGPGARPMHPDWARSLRDQCQAAGVAFHFKQWGEWGPQLPRPPMTVPRSMWHHACGLIQDTMADPDPLEFFCEEWVFKVGKKAAGRELDGCTWDEVPG